MDGQRENFIGWQLRFSMREDLAYRECDSPTAMMTTPWIERGRKLAVRRRSPAGEYHTLNATFDTTVGPPPRSFASRASSPLSFSSSFSPPFSFSLLLDSPFSTFVRLCVFLFLHRSRFSLLSFSSNLCSMFLGFFPLLTYLSHILFFFYILLFFLSLSWSLSWSLFICLLSPVFLFFPFSSLASPNRTFSLSSSSIARYFLVLLSKSEPLIIF